MTSIKQMSKSRDSPFNLNVYRNQIDKLKEVIKEHEEEHKRKDYMISWMKAEIRLLNDSLLKVKNVSKSAVDEVESMNELAGACLDDGRYLRWDGEEIYYRGEEKPEPFKPLADNQIKKKRFKSDD